MEKMQELKEKCGIEEKKLLYYQNTLQTLILLSRYREAIGLTSVVRKMSEWKPEILNSSPLASL
jgi:hypothetical protein